MEFYQLCLLSYWDTEHTLGILRCSKQLEPDKAPHTYPTDTTVRPPKIVFAFLHIVQAECVISCCAATLSYRSENHALTSYDGPGAP